MQNNIVRGEDVQERNREMQVSILQRTELELNTIMSRKHELVAECRTAEFTLLTLEFNRLNNDLEEAGRELLSSKTVTEDSIQTKCVHYETEIVRLSDLFDMIDPKLKLPTWKGKQPTSPDSVIDMTFFSFPTEEPEDALLTSDPRMKRIMEYLMSKTSVSWEEFQVDWNVIMYPDLEVTCPEDTRVRTLYPYVLCVQFQVGILIYDVDLGEKGFTTCDESVLNAYLRSMLDVVTHPPPHPPVPLHPPLLATERMKRSFSSMMIKRYGKGVELLGIEPYKKVGGGILDDVEVFKCRVQGPKWPGRKPHTLVYRYQFPGECLQYSLNEDQVMREFSSRGLVTN